MNSTNKLSILIIGAGNMGCSIAKGLLAKQVSENQLIFCEQQTARHDQLADTFPHSDIIADLTSLTIDPDVILLAVKPNDIQAVCLQIAQCNLHQSLIISIAAGVPVKAFQQWLGKKVSIVRCMPNTPAAIGAGITGLFTPEYTSENRKDIANEILSAIGKTVWVDNESLIDSVTAISGSGPAYLFYFMECMQASAINLGLNSEDSYQLTLQTMLGAAQLANHENISFQQLRENVTSKGGTTEQALLSFHQNNTQHIIDQAVNAAANKAAEISQSFDDKE